MVHLTGANGRYGIGITGELVVTVLNGDLTDDQWLELLLWTRERIGKSVGSLSYQASGSVTAKQRQMAAENGNPQALRRVALLTDSVLIRGSLTAYSWLTRGKTKYISKAPAKRDEAVVWLREELSFETEAAHRLLSDLCRATSSPTPWLASAV